MTLMRNVRGTSEEHEMNEEGTDIVDVVGKPPAVGSPASTRGSWQSER